MLRLTHSPVIHTVISLDNVCNARFMKLEKQFESIKNEHVEVEIYCRIFCRLKVKLPNPQGDLNLYQESHDFVVDKIREIIENSGYKPY